MSRERRLFLIGAAILGALAFSIVANSAPPSGPGGVSTFAILSTASSVIMGNAERVVSQPGNIGATRIKAGRSGSFSNNLIASVPSGKAIRLGRVTSVLGRCASGGGAINLRPGSACNGGEDSSGANPLLHTLSDAIEDAAGFAQALESYSATQTLEARIKVGRSRTATIALTPGFNVVDIPAISVGEAAALVLDGASTTSAVIRVAGDLTLGKAARLNLLGGIVPQNVVVFVNGSAVSLGNKSSLSGTLFASAAACELGADILLTGSLICRGRIKMGTGDVVRVTPVALNLLTAKLYVMDAPLTFAPNLREYSNPDPLGGDIPPLGVLGGPATALLNPAFLALDRVGSGNAYVSNPNSGSLPQSINVFAPPINGDRAPSPFIFGPNTDLTSPAGIALDGSSNIYVANTTSNRITVFPAGSNGDQFPIFTIQGADTGLSSPVGLALDSNEDIWVVNTAGSISLTEYLSGQCASGSTCDQPPTAVITNPALSGPLDLAFDHQGNIWVTNPIGNSNSSLLEFSPSGKLIATIAGAQTTLNFPIGIALDGAGELLVGNFAGASVLGFNPAACTSADPQPCDLKPDFILAGPTSQLLAPAGLALGP
ncbi:MAG TPA: NHL repeat-containing protein [Candidatus Binataceae bacterium]